MELPADPDATRSGLGATGLIFQQFPAFLNPPLPLIRQHVARTLFAAAGNFFCPYAALPKGHRIRSLFPQYTQYLGQPQEKLGHGL
jgi:hypothetical protein